MRAATPATLDIPVPGGQLRALRWGTGPDVVVAVHGISGSGMSWLEVALSLPPGWSLVAPDLRGRGHSAGLAGPYGFDRHVADVTAVIECVGRQPVLAGHSMGAYVALLTWDAHPHLASRLVLVDGGLPLPVPPDPDLDAILDASLGPAIARLSQTFASEDAYVAFWRAHPAFASDWNRAAETYVRYDLMGEPGALRSRAVPEAVRADHRDLLMAGDRVGGALTRLTQPTDLLTAPAGMFGEPPGLHPPDLVSAWLERAPALRPHPVAGVNHYTLLFAPRGAAAVAEALTRGAPD